MQPLQTAFLIIFSLVGAGYAVFTKQMKMALGLFILTIAFVLQIPNMVTGFWVDLFTALSIIIFAVGIFAMIWQKKDREPIVNKEENKIEEDKKN